MLTTTQRYGQRAPPRRFAKRRGEPRLRLSRLLRTSGSAGLTEQCWFELSFVNFATVF